MCSRTSPGTKSSNLIRARASPGHLETGENGKREGLMIKKLPSEYFHNQIYTTFFNDAGRAHSFLVGHRQLHVVQRFSARQLDLAQFSSSPRPRPGRLPRPVARQARARKRVTALQYSGSQSDSVRPRSCGSSWTSRGLGVGRHRHRTGRPYGHARRAA